jgi:hypothetical protein
MFVTQCSTENIDSDFPPLNLQLDGTLYSVPASSYLNPTGQGDFCHFDSIIMEPMGYSSLRWILGNRFLNKFYQVYDMERNHMGLALSEYNYEFENSYSRA